MSGTSEAHPVRKKESEAVDVLAPTSRNSPFLSFRYSYTEMECVSSW
jgi:hypothetical protein